MQFMQKVTMCSISRTSHLARMSSTLHNCTGQTLEACLEPESRDLSTKVYTSSPGVQNEVHASTQVAAGAGMVPCVPAVIPPPLPAYVPVVLDGRLIGHIQSGGLLSVLPESDAAENLVLPRSIKCRCRSKASVKLSTLADVRKRHVWDFLLVGSIP